MEYKIDCDLASFSSIEVLDEIALEGLEGLTPESLWIRIEARFKRKLTLHMKAKLWDAIANMDETEFYILSEPRPIVKVFDRYKMINSEASLSGARRSLEFPDIYSYHPVPNVLGSCKNYDKRIDVTDNVLEYSFAEINDRMYNIMVVVACQDARWKALGSHLFGDLKNDIVGAKYCMLERIGRSRYNGELSTGNNSLSIFTYDPMIMSYLRNCLIKNKFVKKQTILLKNPPKPTFTRLFHLPRFYKQYPFGVHHNMKLLYGYFKKNEKSIVLFEDLQCYLLKHMEKKSFDEFILTSEFKGKVILSQNTLYRELYPDAPERDWKKDSGEERKLHTIKLIDNAQYNMIDEDDSEEDEAAE